MTKEALDSMWIRNLPRSVRFGLLSVLGVLILSIPALSGVDSPFVWGTISIPLLLGQIGCPGFLSIIGTAAFWYTVGGFLGRSKLHWQTALAIWVVIQVLMLLFGFLTLLAFRSMYN